MNRSIFKGAVIVQKCDTGEILAMASRPNFDAGNLGEYLHKDSSPLLNRALSSYHPGSVFKLVVAAAALEHKIIKPTDTFYDPGYIDIKETRFWAWDYERGARGRINLREALAFSSNPVFIQVALNTGERKILDMAEKMGFGSYSPLGLGGEMSGRLPTAKQLYSGDLANLAIGQGFCEATPLQIAQCTAIIANGGVKVEPYIVSAVKTPDGRMVKHYRNSLKSKGTQVISRQTAAELKKMMVAVTSFGTGQAAYLDAGGSAGKTGSAETGRRDAGGRGVSHAWFAGYTPIDNPKYVIVVFVEDGMSGGDIAAPIFREIAAEVMRLD
jgi:cell division protein FtsI/penicillin-binding protein 2